MGTQALELYRQMSQSLINEVTYICVLNACSHCGFVDQARSIFHNIQGKTSSIYSTMVRTKDCLWRFLSSTWMNEFRSIV